MNIARTNVCMRIGYRNPVCGSELCLCNSEDCPDEYLMSVSGSSVIPLASINISDYLHGYADTPIYVVQGPDYYFEYVPMPEYHAWQKDVIEEINDGYDPN